MRLVYSLLLLVILVAGCGLGMADEVVITAYYPAPFGEYQEIRTMGNTFLLLDRTDDPFVGIGTTERDDLDPGAVQIKDADIAMWGGLNSVRCHGRTLNNNTSSYLFLEPEGLAPFWFDIGAYNFYTRFSAPNANMHIDASVIAMQARDLPGVYLGGIRNVGIGTETPSDRLQVIGNVRADNFLTPSSREFKKGITPLAEKDYERILSQIRSTSVFTYRLKVQADDAKPHLGIVAEEAPEALLDSTGKALSFTDSVGFLLAGMKALAEENAALRKEVELLKGKI